VAIVVIADKPWQEVAFAVSQKNRKSTSRPEKRQAEPTTLFPARVSIWCQRWCQIHRKTPQRAAPGRQKVIGKSPISAEF
jgi:hypothetical protein